MSDDEKDANDVADNGLAKTFEEQIQFIRQNYTLYYGIKDDPDLLGGYKQGILVYDEAYYLRRVGNAFQSIIAYIRSAVFQAVIITPIIEGIASIRGLYTLIQYFSYNRLKVYILVSVQTFLEIFTVYNYDPVKQGPGNITGKPFL